MIPAVSDDKIRAALKTFDDRYRDTPEWQGWVADRNYKHALDAAGRLYPPKMTVSLATEASRKSFSGGPQTNRYLEARGFEILSLDSISALLAYWMRRYPVFAPGEGFGKAHELWPVKSRLEALLQDAGPVTTRSEHLAVEASAGKGRLAKDPWIAVFDRRETQSVQRGRYVVFLFRRDMSGVYLTLNQGVTDLFNELGASKASKELERRAAELRAKLHGLETSGFALDNDVDLAPDGLGSKYEASTVAHRFYPVDDLPDDETLLDDLGTLLNAYEQILDSTESPQLPEPSSSSGGPTTLAEVHRAFSDALLTAGLRFGAGPAHDAFVRAFLASIATKRFVILTGLSGSGKTQIGLRFGEWLGDDAFLLVPVRPDWTGPEALLGYENALAAPSETGRTPWYVPTTLAFMLETASARQPRLLLLDEMNLAHVERYFADVLSGMESGTGCLPNLVRDAANGRWCWGDDDQPAPFPPNLFVVGTVNVDETTYMFSPKVLDRANTIEFRVRSSDLPEDPLSLKRPMACPPGSSDAVNALLEVALSPNWHIDHAPSFLPQFAQHMRALHELLDPHGFAFGHRVYMETARFAAIHHAMGGDGLDAALDLQVMQKLLPRLHGARRRLEPVLRILGSYAVHLAIRDDATEFDPAAEIMQPPRLPISFDKIRRMTHQVRANQFASFAE